MIWTTLRVGKLTWTLFNLLTSYCRDIASAGCNRKQYSCILLRYNSNSWTVKKWEIIFNYRCHVTKHSIFLIFRHSTPSSISKGYEVLLLVIKCRSTEYACSIHPHHPPRDDVICSPQVPTGDKGTDHQMRSMIMSIRNLAIQKFQSLAN